MWSYPVFKWMITALLMLTFVVSFAGYVAASVINDDLLQARFYQDALQKNHIYDRVYTELLADPALQSVTESLLGNLHIGAVDSQIVYSQTVSALRLIVPPNVLQKAAERLIVELVAYLSGRRDRLDANLDLGRLIYDSRLEDRIATAIQSIQTKRLAQTRISDLLLYNADEPSPLTVAALSAEANDYLTTLAAGELKAIPEELLYAKTSQLSAAEQRAIADVLLAPVAGSITEATRMQVEAALANDNLPDAIVIVSRELVALRAEEVVANLRAEFKSGNLSGVGALAKLADREKRDVVGELNTLRDLIRVFRRDVTPVLEGALVMSFAALLVLHARDARRALRLGGVTLLLSGVVVVLAWVLVGSLSSVPYRALTAETVDVSLPPSLRVMLNDVLDTLVADLREMVFARAAVVLLIGLMLVALSFVHGATGIVWRVLQPMNKRQRLAMAGLALIVVLVPLLVDHLVGERRAAQARELRCNGYATLCDRPFNEVAFAATHNAMSVSSQGWVWPEQDGTLTDQLRAGVRALLIDTHYGDTPQEIEAYLAYFPPTTRPIMENIIQAADPSLKGPGTFLCHNLCSLGGTSLVSGLTEIRAYMDRHPYEVVVLIIQDEVTPEDTARAFDESGLSKYVYTYDPQAGWLTLREMIQRNERLVVFAQRSGPPPDWYLHAWDYLEETPYRFGDARQFSCAPNRGESGRPLFLLNHWIAEQSPDRVNAAFVNSYDFLLRRAQVCAEERGQMPNFIAVNFYSIGDVFAVVDTLNGVRKPE